MNVECLRRPSLSNPTTLYHFRWLRKDEPTTQLTQLAEDLRFAGSFKVERILSPHSSKRSISNGQAPTGSSFHHGPVADMQDDVTLQVGLCGKPLEAGCQAVLITDFVEFLHLPQLIDEEKGAIPVQILCTEAAYEVSRVRLCVPCILNCRRLILL